MDEQQAPERVVVESKGGVVEREAQAPTGQQQGPWQVVEDPGGRLLTQAVRRAQLVRLAVRGLNARQAARVLKCSHATVVQVYQDPAFKKACLERLSAAWEGADGDLAAMKLTLHERIIEKSETAFEKLCEMLDSPAVSPNLRAKIAMDMLDRNPETQQGYTVREGKIDAEQLATAAKVAREMDNVIPMKRGAA